MATRSHRRSLSSHERTSKAPATNQDSSGAATTPQSAPSGGARGTGNPGSSPTTPSQGGSSTGDRGRCSGGCSSHDNSGSLGATTFTLSGLGPVSTPGAGSATGTTIGDFQDALVSAAPRPSSQPVDTPGLAAGATGSSLAAATTGGPSLAAGAGGGSAVVRPLGSVNGSRPSTISGQDATGSLTSIGASVTVRQKAQHRSQPPATTTPRAPVTSTNTAPASVRRPAPDVIERFVAVVPEAIWIALAGSLLLAAAGVAVALRSGRRVRRQAGQFAAVSAAALTDPLTGVLNRRGFLDAAERELARARRYERPFTLAYADVRGLKRVNDTKGHLAGDALLKQAAALLTASARADDLVGRIGGDELALLLPEQSSDGATALTERIKDELPASREAAGVDARWDLTVGTATFPEDGETIEELLEVADRRLYQQRGISLR